MPHRSRTPTARLSRSAAVRQALLRPSARQRSKWQRDARHRRLIWAVGGVLAVLVGAVLGYGYWRENIARGHETAATVHGTTITLNDLIPWVKPRFQGIQQTMDFYRAQGLEQQATQLRLQMVRIPDQVVNQQVEALLVRAEVERREITVSDAEVDAKIRQQMAEQAAANAPLPTATPTATGQATAVTPTSRTPGPTGSPEANTAVGAATQAPAGSATAPAPTVASPSENSTPSETATQAGTPTPTLTPTPVATLSADSFKVTYQAFLDRTGYTERQYRQLTLDGVFKEKLQQAIGAEIPTVQEQVHARQVVVGNKDKAQAILDKLQQGQSFEALAKSDSTDGTSKDKGGDLGWLPRGIESPDWDAAAFTLQPGQRSGLVDLPGRGTAIVEVIERDPARPLSEEQLSRLRQAAYRTWLDATKSDPSVSTPTLTSEQRSYVLQMAGAPKLS